MQLSPLPIDRFALQAHAGPYQRWPGHSPLIVDGELQRTSVPGYTLLRQFALADGYLLITDFDCPFEESTCFVLLDPQFKVRSQRTLGGMYASYLLKRVRWLDERQLIASFVDQGDWLMAIRSWSMPYLRPRLSLRRTSKPA